MIFENHNMIAHVVFCFRLSPCQKTDTCNIVTSINGIYRGCLLFEVNTKYISSNVLKISVISRVRSANEIADLFNP